MIPAKNGLSSLSCQKNIATGLSAGIFTLPCAASSLCDKLHLGLRKKSRILTRCFS